MYECLLSSQLFIKPNINTPAAQFCPRTLNSGSFSYGVNNEWTPSQRLTYKRIYFSCAQRRIGTELKQNNDWGHEAFCVDFHQRILFMSVTHLLYQLYNSRRPIFLQRCSASYSEDLAWMTVAHTPRQCFIFRCVELHVDRNRQIPSAICGGSLLLESRTAVCSSVIWMPSAVTVHPDTRWCVCLCSIKVNFVFDALLKTYWLREWREERWVPGFLYMSAQTAVWINIMITTSTDRQQDIVFDCCQWLQFDHTFVEQKRETISRWRSFVHRNLYAVLHGDYLFWAQQQKMIQKAIKLIA